MDFRKTESMLFLLTSIPIPFPSPQPHLILAYTNGTYYSCGSKKQIDPNKVCFVLLRFFKKASTLHFFPKKGEQTAVLCVPLISIDKEKCT